MRKLLFVPPTKCSGMEINMELKIENLEKNFNNVKAISNISYTMHNGVYGLLGLNGAGKTTLMRMICTLLQPTSGNITCNGRNIFEMGAKYRNLLGYLPQEFGYYPDFTVKDYMFYIASIKGMRPNLSKQIIDKLLMQVGLKNIQNKKMKHLSGGMKRRVGIAQAMINNPKILVLDEPTAGLDPNERIRFRNLISELSQERLVLHSTHIVSDIENIANEILLMEEGKIMYAGSPEKAVKELPIKVWNFQINKFEQDNFIKNYKVVNIKTFGDMVEMTVLSNDKPFINAKEQAITLEDVFLYYFGEKVGGEDVVF